MSKDLSPMDSFMEKLRGRIRNDIGELLPEEVINAMVAKVVNDEFFGSRKVKDEQRSSYSNTVYKELPSPFQEMVVEAAAPIIKAQVLKILDERQDVIGAQIEEGIKKGLTKLAFEVIDQVIVNAVNKNGYSIAQQIANELRNMGHIR